MICKSHSQQGVLAYLIHIPFEARIHLQQISCFFFTPSVVSYEAVKVLFSHLQHWMIKQILDQSCRKGGVGDRWAVQPCNGAYPELQHHAAQQG